MNFIKIVAVFFITALFLLVGSACSSNRVGTNDFFNQFSDIDEGTVLLLEYGHSPFNFPENHVFYYTGGYLVIPYVFYGGRVDSEVGLFVFIDGVVQPYFVNSLNESELKYLHIFNIEANSEKIIELHILPTVGRLNDNLQLNFVCLEFPLILETDDLMVDLQGISTTISWTLSFLEDIPANHNTQIQERFFVYSITSEGSASREIGGYMHLDFVDTYEGFEVKINNLSDVRLFVYGWSDATFRTCVQ